MNKNAKIWVAALRSGQYKQGKNALRRGDTYCCMGVACDLFDSTHWNEESGYRAPGSGTDNNIYLPGQIRRWFGLNDIAGTYGRGECLTYHNDNGMSFDEIADLIESEPKGLFA